VLIGDQVVDEFELTPEVTIASQDSAHRGAARSGDLVEMQLSVDRTFVPALVNPGVSKDPRSSASACSTRSSTSLARWFPRLALRGSQSRQLRLGRVQLVEAAVGVEFVTSRRRW